MQNIMQQIDDSAALFLAAVLVILLISATAGWIGARMELKDYAKKKMRADEARRAQWIKAVYDDIDIPAYQREAKHPLDSAPYDIRKLN